MRCKTSRDIYETIILVCIHALRHTHTNTHTHTQDFAQRMCASILFSNHTPNPSMISSLNCPCASVFMHPNVMNCAHPPRRVRARTGDSVVPTSPLLILSK